MAEPAGTRVAVINDNTSFLELMQDLLESLGGYQVILCKEGNRAYQFVKEQRPDLVILDIRMGGEEIGWTILEMLTLDPETRPIPLIVCSAAITDLQAHEPLLRQFDIGILPKPFDVDVLLEQVRVALG